MKKSSMKTLENLKKYSLMAVVLLAFIVTGCSSDDDAPDEENELEVITNVTLIFTNVNDATDIVEAEAEDPDGLGVEDLEILDDIELSADTEYTLTFEILNALDEDDVEDIGEEILEEDDEHQIFFSFTEDAFSDPAGDGNIDSASDAVNYNDEDENGYPVGLSTSWTTGTALTDGTFTVNLQHQPDLKTATSGADDGDTDFFLTFDLIIE